LIAEAYDTLKDENGRRQYNAQIDNGYRHPAWKTNGQCLTQAFLVFEKAFNNMAV
jgi:DnaJ-class molecular chaperone